MPGMRAHWHEYLAYLAYLCNALSPAGRVSFSGLVAAPLLASFLANFLSRLRGYYKGQGLGLGLALPIAI